MVRNRIEKRARTHTHTQSVCGVVVDIHSKAAWEEGKNFFLGVVVVWVGGAGVDGSRMLRVSRMLKRMERERERERERIRKEGTCHYTAWIYLIGVDQGMADTWHIWVPERRPLLRKIHGMGTEAEADR